MILTRQDISEFEDAYLNYSLVEEQLEERYNDYEDPHRVISHLIEHREKHGEDLGYTKKCWREMAPEADFLSVKIEENYRNFLEWLSNHPQVLMSGADFHEFVGAHNSNLYRSLIGAIGGTFGPRPAFRNLSGLWLLPSMIPRDPEIGWDAYCLDAVKKFDKDRITDDILDDCVVKLPDFSSILTEARRFIDNPVLDPTILMSPRMWTPQSQEEQKHCISAPATALVVAMQEERIDLTSLTWRQFEEVVAETLRRLGMEIYVVRESPQGGRDIIARGELIPGLESVTVAVEVKHRNFVDRPEVQKAIHQNRMFPALLFVTSGRFSAGVLKEARLPENRLRLFLKNGMAVRELLKRFPFDS